MPERVDGGAFDLGAAEIDADTKSLCHRTGLFNRKSEPFATLINS